jgi:AraC family transcriptional regulator, regulatory protein of adaptative response / methylated-DNA-[protein]-cysteine methyltransferase
MIADAKNVSMPTALFSTNGALYEPVDPASSEDWTRGCLPLLLMDVDPLLAAGIPQYDWIDAPFGRLLVAGVGKQIVCVSLGDSDTSSLSALQKRFPFATFTYSPELYAPLAGIFHGNWPIAGYHLCVQGTPFQTAVWQALMQIPSGRLTSYAAIAKAIARPRAVRAVGTAIGRNPIAYFIPCHRVVPAGGGIGGYYWGAAVKRRILDSELVISD